MRRELLILPLVGLAAGCGARDLQDAATRPALEKAIHRLSEEAPSWHPENRCFSCHHDGDATRVLLAVGKPPPDLAPTLEWLAHPERWDEQGGPDASSDRALARFQFSAALAEAVASGRSGLGAAARTAAGLLVEVQDAGGSFPVDPADAPASPATWGTTLATAMAVRTLLLLDAQGTRAAVEAARHWLREAPLRSVADAAAVLLGLGPSSETRRDNCLALLRNARAPGGGWGPHPGAPPEAFDTALVVLALASLPARSETLELLADGRRHLVRSQREDGSWPATTRPAGGESRAQETSTTAWAALALLASGGQ